jgi:hypothetical protein
VTHPRPRAPLPHVLGRDPRLRQPPVGEQFAQPARVLTIGLGAALAPAQGARLHRLGQMRHRAGGHQRVTDEQPARARLQPRHTPPGDQTASRPPFHGRRRRVDAATHHSPESVSNASKVICARCTSNPAAIAIGASSKAPALPPRASLSRRAEEALAPPSLRSASRSRIDARLLGTGSRRVRRAIGGPAAPASVERQQRRADCSYPCI